MKSLQNLLLGLFLLLPNFLLAAGHEVQVTFSSTKYTITQNPYTYDDMLMTILNHHRSTITEELKSALEYIEDPSRSEPIVDIVNIWISNSNVIKELNNTSKAQRSWQFSLTPTTDNRPIFTQANDGLAIVLTINFNNKHFYNLLLFSPVPEEIEADMNSSLTKAATPILSKKTPSNTDTTNHQNNTDAMVPVVELSHLQRGLIYRLQSTNGQDYSLEIEALLFSLDREFKVLLDDDNIIIYREVIVPMVEQLKDIKFNVALPANTDKRPLTIFEMKIVRRGMLFILKAYEIYAAHSFSPTIDLGEHPLYCAAVQNDLRSIDMISHFAAHHLADGNQLNIQGDKQSTIYGDTQALAYLTSVGAALTEDGLNQLYASKDYTNSDIKALQRHLWSHRLQYSETSGEDRSDYGALVLSKLLKGQPALHDYVLSIIKRLDHQISDNDPLLSKALLEFTYNSRNNNTDVSGYSLTDFLGQVAVVEEKFSKGNLADNSTWALFKRKICQVSRRPEFQPKILERIRNLS